MHNLLCQLSRRHEVHQFSQALGAFSPWGSVEEWRVTRSYREHRYSHPLAWSVVEAGRRACLGAPVLAGLGLRLSRPSCLRRLVDWADVILVEFPWQFEHCRRWRPDGRFVLSTHNVESLKFASWGEAAERPSIGARWARYIERSEANAVSRADLVLAVSSADRNEFIRRYGVRPDRVIEIPNGADTRELAPATPEAKAAAKRGLRLPAKPTVIFSASDIPPNRRGLEWVRRLAARTDRFTFLVVGGVTASATRERNLVATGPVEEVGCYFDAADMAICPIEHGGGTKIKLLESFAAGLPTVAFADVLRGVAARDGVHVLAAEKSEEGLLSALDRLLDEPRLAQQLGSRGRRLAAEDYDWARIAERLERELVRLAGPAA
jgi:glycosyltransferase involved in cell wall biosynthesis